jgi:hypothetical protein
LDDVILLEHLFAVNINLSIYKILIFLYTLGRSILTTTQETTMRVIEYFHELVSLGKNKIKRSLDNLFAQGDWQFLQLNNYTSVSPLVVNQGSTTKLQFQPADIFFQAGRSLSLNYNFTSQKFQPQTLNDVFLVEIRFKAKASAQNAAYEIRLESPTFPYNPVQAQSGSVSKSAGVEQFISLAVPVFIGPEIFANGLEVYFKADSGNFQVYDMSYMVVRLTSGM